MSERQIMKLFHGITNIGDDIIEEAMEAQPNRVRKMPSPWVRWGMAAACVCLIMVGVLARTPLGEQPAAMPADSSEELAPFAVSEGDSATRIGGGKGGEATGGQIKSNSLCPYAETRYFSDQQEQLEAENVIPSMEEHPIFTCAAHYNEDGSLYSLVFQWHREGEHYSNLQITVAEQPIEEPNDCILVEVDENGQPIETKPTIIERDGVSITTEGKEDQEKTMTFQNDSGWYQIAGSWNDTFSDLDGLLDWVLAHPVDLSRFPIEAGDNYQSCPLAEKPNAFANYLPDFAGYGFVEEEAHLNLKNGTPVRFEGHYVAHVDKALVESGTYYDTEGYTLMHWCFETEPNVYDFQNSAGELKDLTKKQVLNILEKESSITFTWDGYATTVFPQKADEAWMLIQSLQDSLD